MRVKATIEYLGTAYSGWQSQPNQPTVQVALEHALQVVVGERVRVDGAGRTDAGVHALGQVAAFDLPDGTDLYRLLASINGLTERDISVIDLEEVAAGFDPRRNAKKRSYRYTIVSGRPPSALLGDRAWHVPSKLDQALLDRLAASIIGEHDFNAFRARDCEAPGSTREVFASSWQASAGIYTYQISANAFLKQMVRVLVGSMVDVALGKLEEPRFYQLLGGGERSEAGRTAPAAGLVLVSVDY